MSISDILRLASLLASSAFCCLRGHLCMCATAALLEELAFSLLFTQPHSQEACETITISGDDRGGRGTVYPGVIRGDVT